MEIPASAEAATALLLCWKKSRRVRFDWLGVFMAELGLLFWIKKESDARDHLVQRHLASEFEGALGGFKRGDDFDFFFDGHALLAGDH